MKDISKNLTFSQDVMAFRCSHVLDYDEEKVNSTVYRGPRYGRQRTSLAASDQSTGLPPKHSVCHLNGPLQNKLVHKPKAFLNIDDQMKQELDDILVSVAKTSRPCKYSVAKAEYPEKSSQSSAEWDEYVLALLSKSTAKLLSDEMTTGSQQVRLINFLKNRYSEVGKDSGDHEEQKEDPSKPRNSRFGNELEKVLTEANFEPHYSPSFTFPPAVGDKKFTSDNVFQQEMLAGAFPVRGRNRVPRKSIVLDTNSHLKFEKKLQANFPEDPKKWSQGRRNSKAVKFPGKVVKGLQRWNELPALLQVLNVRFSKKSYSHFTRSCFR